MENPEVLDARIGLPVDGSMLSSNSFKGSDSAGNDSAFYEKFILDDMDSYWDDLNARLTVSRMVSDSVIKGMVNAVTEEAAEKIASKEAEIDILNERLHFYESKGNMLESVVQMAEPSTTMVKPKKTKPESPHVSLDASLEWRLGRLRVAAEEQLRKTKEEIENLRSSNSLCGVNACSATEKLLEIDESCDTVNVILAAVFEQVDGMFCTLMGSVCDKKWEEEFQREVSAIVIQYSIRGLTDDFETKLCEQRSLISTLNQNWQKKFDELSTMRQELDAISRSLFSCESGMLLLHSVHESSEEWMATKRRDNFPRKVSGNHHVPCTSHSEENGIILMEESGESGKTTLELSDSPQLKCKTKEELITYYKTEMTMMKRQHESALQEKTEELFSLKREFLREKGSLPFRKDKEFELLRKKIPEVILKFDDILSENEKMPMVQYDHDELHSLKDRIDTLFVENRRLRGLLTGTRKEVNCLSSQISDAANQVSHHSSIEANLLKQMKRLKRDIEDVKIVATIRDEIHKCVLRELLSELKCDMEDLEMETKIMQEIYSVMFREVGDSMSTLNPIIVKYNEKNDSLETALLEKDNALCLEIEENKKLKQEIASLSALIKEKEKFVSELCSTLMQQKEHFDLVCQELNVLRDRVSKQEILISVNKTESDTIKGRLDETSQHISQYEVEITELHQKLKIASDALEEAEKEKSILHGAIQEEQKTLSVAITNEKERRKLMESIVASMIELSKAVVDCEGRLAEKIERNASSLKVLSHQCNPLVQQANLLKRKGLRYKQRFEIRCSDLQKAEIEVDLLGDEVDALLSLLEKIYIALDHYSPVLQHYPGMDYYNGGKGSFGEKVARKAILDTLPGYGDSEIGSKRIKWRNN